MTSNQTEPTDDFDTAELEPAPPAADDVGPGRPSWEPDDGDFG